MSADDDQIVADYLQRLRVAASALPADRRTGQHVIHHLAGSCTTTSGPPAWLAISIAVILLTAAIAGPVFTAIRLLRRARRAPAERAADPAALLSV